MKPAMQARMIGLGRMGVSTVTRLGRRQHDCVVNDRPPQAAGILHVDVSTSGGGAGLERGDCPAAARQQQALRGAKG